MATASAPAHMWFVKTGGEVWGPYPEARVAIFAREGRVRPTTLLSPFAQGPWTPAADSVEFAELLRPSGAPIAAAPAPAVVASPNAPPSRPLNVGAVAHGHPPPSAPAPARLQPSPNAVPATGPDHSFLIFVDLASVAPAAFQAGLGRLGRCVLVRPGLWLLRAPTTAASLRNLLSSHLGAGDALLVVDAPLDRTAWFNLAPGQDRDLRRLWAGG